MDLTSFIAEVKTKLNIIEVCQKYITLSQKGGKFWACCPFHHEKTPSFSVNENGYFHCFGCGESGDAIKFIQHMEGTDFMGALEVAAGMVGMQVPKFTRGGKDEGEARRRHKERLSALARDTAFFYYGNIKTEKAKKAQEYLLSRGIDGVAVKRFGIGYSINWDDLPRFLKSRGYSEEEMLDAGVCDRKNGKIYDSLGGRLIIPIIDGFKSVVAFGGRVLEKTDFAKYKNTRETELFIKSKTLYGLNLVKEARKSRKIEELIVVEGYMDAISLYQAGFDNVVASMGTSLTKDQARLMKFLVNKVYISYDGDIAGLKASVRGLDILQNEGIDVKVALMPDGMDPDDVIKKLGKERYLQALEEAMPLVDFKLHILRSETVFTDSISRRKYIQNCIVVISKIRENAVKSELIEKLSREVGIKYESLMQDLEEYISGNLAKENLAKQTAREENPDLKKGSVDEEKNFLIYALVSRLRTLEDVEDVVEIFSAEEIAMISDFTQKKMPLASLFDIMGSDSYDIIKYDEVENKSRYFEDVLKLEKNKIYTRHLTIAKARLKIAKSKEESEKLLKEIAKYTKLKKG